MAAAQRRIEIITKTKPESGIVMVTVKKVAKGPGIATGIRTVRKGTQRKML
jgi:hypothetical protein